MAKVAGFQKILGARKSLDGEAHRLDEVRHPVAGRVVVIDDTDQLLVRHFGLQMSCGKLQRCNGSKPLHEGGPETRNRKVRLPLRPTQWTWDVGNRYLGLECAVAIRRRMSLTRAQDSTDKTPSCSAIRTRSTSDAADIFRMIWLRWTLIVFSLSLSS